MGEECIIKLDKKPDHSYIQSKMTRGYKLDYILYLETRRGLYMLYICM